VGWIIGGLFSLLFLAGTWKVFTKAGQPGYFAFIPGLNLLVLLKLADRPFWWALPLLVPAINLLTPFVEIPYGWFGTLVAFPFLVLMNIGVSKRFGYGSFFGLMLTFLPMVFYPVLGFGGSKALYLGESRASG